MSKPFINWEELAKLAMPAPPKRPEGAENKGPKKGYGGWDNQAEFYNRMAKMEAEFTLNQINCFDTSKEDTVLDVGCGPGRITVPMAKRAKSVTSLDASPKMLEFCEANAKEAGLDNVTTKLFDWETEDLSTLGKFDIVIASRTVALQDLVRLSSLAKKYAAIVIWSYGCPSIPEIVGKLFEGTDDRPMGRPPHNRDRRLGNNLWYNRVYDLGFDPNLKIVEDGFTRTFENREQAYEELRKLRPELAADKVPIFKKNTDAFLTENADGTVTFLSKTKSIVLWWKPERVE